MMSRNILESGCVYCSASFSSNSCWPGPPSHTSPGKASCSRVAGYNPTASQLHPDTQRKMLTFKKHPDILTYTEALGKIWAGSFKKLGLNWV